MEINQNQTNLSPVDLKSSGGSALNKADVNQQPGKVVELMQIKSFSEANQAKSKGGTEKNNISSVVAKINEQVQSIQRDIVFSIDKDSGRDVVIIKDANNDKVIKQIPTEEMLDIARKLEERINEDDHSKIVDLFSSIA